MMSDLWWDASGWVRLRVGYKLLHLPWRRWHAAAVPPHGFCGDRLRRFWTRKGALRWIRAYRLTAPGWRLAVWPWYLTSDPNEETPATVQVIADTLGLTAEQDPRTHREGDRHA